MEESSIGSRVVCTGITAANDAIVRLMKDYKEKTFLELSNDLMRVATEVTGAVLTSLTQELSDEQGLDEAPCPHCGTVVARHSKAKRTLESRHGVTTVERAYCHCTKCKVGFVPFDEKMGLAPQRSQYDLQAAAATLAKRLPFAEAAAVFEQLTGMKMSAHIMHGVVSRLGEVAETKTVLRSASAVKQKIGNAPDGILTGRRAGRGS